MGMDDGSKREEKEQQLGQVRLFCGSWEPRHEAFLSLVGWSRTLTYDRVETGAPLFRRTSDLLNLTIAQYIPWSLFYRPPLSITRDTAGMTSELWETAPNFHKNHQN